MGNTCPCCIVRQPILLPGKTETTRPQITRSNSYTQYPPSEETHFPPPIAQATVHLWGLYDYSGQTYELSFAKNDTMLLLDDSDVEWFYARHLTTNEEGYVPANYVAIKDSLDSKRWFMGAINRIEADRLLRVENIPGSFLVRERGTVDGESYALSILTLTQGIKHYKILKDKDQNYMINNARLFKTLDELIEHYSTIEDGLLQKLTTPCSKAKPVLTDLSKDMRDTWEIERSSIQLITKIGSGQFGEVWKGLWNSKVDVAVKMLKEGTMSQESFLAESHIMKCCKHKNLVRLYAVCTIDEPILIVTELMCNGSLLDYLREREDSVPFLQLIDMAAQVASGMSYLEDNKLIHRDIAARNILVGETEVKIADFGLARLLENEEYNPRAGARFPIKWTAPEAMLKSKFSIKSDVWSYGILLIEIFTHGEIPYPGLSNRDVIKFLENGDRLSAPNNCPAKIDDILKCCWNSNPSERPTFAYLHDFFENYEASIECSYD